MATKKTGQVDPEDTALAERRQQVAALYIRGITQAEIGRRYGLNQATVSRDLAAVRAAWLASSIADYGERKAQELARIDAIESEAWAAWERSQTDAETLHAESLKGRVGANGAPLPDLAKTSKTAKGQCGDPRYLERVGWCVEQRCKILGLLAPEKHDHSGTLTVDERRAKLSGVLALLRERAGISPH
jgi:hypothetical protein